MNSAQIKAMVEDEFEELVKIRRDLHMHPELSEHEERTEKAICTQLDKLGIPYEAGVAGHGIIATVGPKDAKYGIAIRADIDALPITECTGLPYASVNKGVMHACGHDIHTTVLLGAARIFKAMENELKGAVKLFFQPAEETTGGAQAICHSGVFDQYRTKAIFGLHLWPDLPAGVLASIPGGMMCRSSEVTLTVTGRSAHVARAGLGRDALEAAARWYLEALSLERQLPPEEPESLRNRSALNADRLQRALPGWSRVSQYLSSRGFYLYQNTKATYFPDGAPLLRDRIDGGHSFEDIVAEMTAFIARMKTRFVLEDLSNLVKNGRISKVAGLLGGMLSLRPIMGDDGHGSIAAIEKVRGTQNAMRRLVELIAEGTREAAASSLTMVLSYCNCPERAMMLKKEFLEKCAALREVILEPTSGLSTVYAYDGGIVLAY